MKLDIINLNKSYGNVKALDNFQVHMEPGIYGILGPNGAGKSTLMNILTDNIKRDDGEILYDGVDILKMGKTYREIVGYMPQEQIGYQQFSALEFLRYMALLKGMDCKSAQVNEQIDELLRTINLYDVRKRKIGGFSGGMKRRVLLAQALLGDPKILILDEPTAGLDPKERISMRNMIAEMAKDRIIILATHIAGDIECIADSVILMKKGRVLHNKPPFELIKTVRPYVREVYCTREELTQYQSQYKISNVIQKKDGLAIHIIEKNEVDQSISDAALSLDDVYLYYFEISEE